MNLLRAAGTVSAFTLLSRITGLAREILTTTLFGASALTDAFMVAFRIPNMLRRLFAEGAFAQAFVPSLAAERAAKGDEATRSLIDATATVLAWALLLVSLAGVIAAPLLVWAMGSGLPREGHDAAVVMTRWMFPYIACMSMVALSAGILNTWKRFAVPAATPVLLNLCVIGCGLALSGPLQRAGWPGIYALALGVMLGGLLQLAVQVPALASLGLVPRIRWRPSEVRAAWAHSGVRSILGRMGPALLGVGVAQLSLLINTQIASHVAVGAVTWVSMADRLMEFPTALAGVALGVVLTPLLAAAKVQGDRSPDQAAEFSSLLDWGLRLVLLLALPCAVALLVFSLPLVAVLFHNGAFTAADAQQTARAVTGYGLGLIGIVAIKVLAPAYFARSDMRTPVRIAIVVLVCTQLFNLGLVPWLGAAGLAVSIGLGALLNAGWLLRGLLRDRVFQPTVGWLGFAAKVALASVAMGSLQAWLAWRLDWLAMDKLPRAGVMAAALLASALLYFGVLALVRVNLRALMRRRAAS
ncbi:MAG: murein biosynthesis integral membrane protein MurJ [Burkholderiales bacterium]|nr:murein biosynthesis integral membrane protein MurJ [Burkholderiales bacterium]